MSSQVAVVIARYSTFALDLATMFCFLLLHGIKLPQRHNTLKLIFYQTANLPNQHQNNRQLEEDYLCFKKETLFLLHSCDISKI